VQCRTDAEKLYKKGGCKKIDSECEWGGWDCCDEVDTKIFVYWEESWE